jgi:ubiquinone biosynthesis protein
VFSAVAGRFLGIRLGRGHAIASGVVGVAIGSLASEAIAGDAQPARSLLSFLFFSVLGTLLCVALLDFLARPATIGQLERSIAAPPHPVRAVRRRAARARRYISILRVASRHRLVSLLAAGAEREGTAADERTGRQLRLALEEAGGLFVKLGQVLSTRADLLPATVTAELALLQDRVAPVAVEEIQAVLERELRRPVSEVFAEFDRQPLAAASLGQVHRARLRDGREVVVKVRRPDVEELVERDLDIILRLAERLERTTTWGKHVGAVALARGFAANLREELDYRVEARNTEAVARLSRVRVPAIHVALSTRAVLVSEWLDGVTVRDAGGRLAELGIERHALAAQLLRSFLHQVLKIGVFNADPHPGNLLVLADGTLAQIDFGSVGRLHGVQQLSLLRLLLAISRTDPELLRDALLELAVVSRRLDVDAFDRALTQFLTLRVGSDAAQGADLFNDLLNVVTRFGLAFDPQLAGAFRALVTLEGTLRVIDPAFVLVDEAKTIAGPLGAGAFGPDALRRAVTDDVLKLGPIARRLPKRVDRITAALARNDWGMNVRLLADERDARLVTRLVDRVVLAFFSAAIGLVSALLVGVDGGVKVTGELSLAQLLGYLGLTVATVLGLRVLVAVSRDRVV